MPVQRHRGDFVILGEPPDGHRVEALRVGQRDGPVHDGIATQPLPGHGSASPVRHIADYTLYMATCTPSKYRVRQRWHASPCHRCQNVTVVKMSPLSNHSISGKRRNGPAKTIG